MIATVLLFLLLGSLFVNCCQWSTIRDYYRQAENDRELEAFFNSLREDQP